MTKHEFWRQEYSRFASFCFFIKTNDVSSPWIYGGDQVLPVFPGNCPLVPIAVNDH